jgi:transposase-like protein
MMSLNSPKLDLITMMSEYHSHEKCLEVLEDLRWPNGVQCPKCQSFSISRIYARNQFDCNTCRNRFSVTAGTIFHDSHLPLNKWFAVVYMMIESKKGISANQVKRILNVSYKTAWYLCHRIRAAMAELNAEMLNGTVEVDETWVGGKLEGHGQGIGNYKKNKSLVVGIIQRNGKVRMQKIEHADRKTLHKFIKDHAAPDTEIIITDEHPAYQGIADQDTKHETVNHKQKEWVKAGDIHTNGIENVWSLLKRSVMGTYHKISKKHLDAYLDELEWRINNRENKYLFRDTLKKLLTSKQMEYQRLIAS